MKSAVLITGCNGGIGVALVDAFRAGGWKVIGTDVGPSAKSKDIEFVRADLSELCSDAAKREAFGSQVRRALSGAALGALVNNAATQELGATQELDVEAFSKSMQVNAVAPFALVKMFLPELERAGGAVVNIGSVHAQATKPGFAAYAASKAALHGLTRALAVDLGPKNIRVNTLAPAAVETDMLRAGFAGRPEAFAALENVHPVGRIASPEEIAKIAVKLASKEFAFMTGATLFVDGGVLSRLHDPV